MKLKLLGIFFSLFTSPACAEPHLAENYQRITIESVKESDSSVRANLSACITNWRSYPEKMARLNETLIQMNSIDSSALILEVGNSGFGRYDFIAANKTAIRSSFATSAKSGIEELQSLVGTLDMSRSQDFIDPGSPSEDDGNCYFLWVRKNGVEQRAAVYGTPGATKIGLIIKKMLALVNSRQRHESERHGGKATIPTRADR